MKAPAQVDVVSIERDRRIEATDFTEQVGTREQERRRQRKHVANTVVLLLVHLANFNTHVDFPKAIDAKPDRLEHSRVVPFDDLGPHHAGIRAIDLFDEQANRVGFWSDVIVTEQEKSLVAFDEP